MDKSLARSFAAATTRRSSRGRLGDTSRQHGLKKLCTLLRDILAEHLVFIEREILATVHPRLLGLRELRQWIAAPDYEVGVLARFE